VAWLDARPSKDHQQTRAERYEQDGIAPNMPEVEAGGYILSYLFELGPVMPAGMTMGPISFLEIDAWQRMTGIQLLPWEARAIRTLSIAYSNQSSISDKPDCPSPMDGPVEKTEVAKHIRNLLRS
jgi:hypothetical protein